MRKRLIPTQQPASLDPSRPRLLALSRWDNEALSRWDNEGGAGPRRAKGSLIPGQGESEKLQLTNNELAQLRIRMIALENLVTALLVDASDEQLDLVREMAAYISPRPGFTRHPLTIHAAAQMLHIVERASHFQLVAPS